jgi:hypothetical protein
MYIVKKGANITMNSKPELPPPVNIEPDRRSVRQRFSILPGPGGYYVYDYKKFTTVNGPDGKCFTSPDYFPAVRFLNTLPQADLTMSIGKKEIPLFHC